MTPKSFEEESLLAGDERNETKRAMLILEDGTTYSGISFGADFNASTSGEVVFQTGMVGYIESLTDPSYDSQILVLTYPLIGNYGVPELAADEFNLPKFFESDKIHASGLIVANYSDEASHWASVRTLSDWLKDQNIPAITGIDTRSLTKKIREHGTMLGKIITGDTDPDTIEFVNPDLQNLVTRVSCPTVKNYNREGDVNILCVDCGIKNSQIRCLAERGACVTVVPWNMDFSVILSKFDGLFISNGPGNPEHCSVLIERLTEILSHDTVLPTFGICMGSQLVGMALGCTLYKLKYGNRGHNQPCTHVETKRCFITSQNHGFALDTSSLNDDVEELFVNENDKTNEGLIHNTRPIMTVQFHPEAMAGPSDTNFLFDVFLDHVKQTKMGQVTMTLKERLTHKLLQKKGLCPRNTPIIQAPYKVLILGSGGLSIGQAGEFDYSGSQAIKALKEEGMQTVLINPNVATVQTSKGLADRVYFLPITIDYVKQVIESERPDGILLSFGGQTALNCGVELFRDGVLETYNVKVLGTPIPSIIATEDRREFAIRLSEIGEKVAPSDTATNLQDVLSIGNKLGFPVLVRTAFALGGMGSGFASDETELAALVKSPLASGSQVIVDKSLKGWKEVEYEVVRDAYDNCIVVCNMENVDPLGIHTGESIVVAPSQTLTNIEYNMLRTVAIKVVRHLGVVGECNIQYALNPQSQQYYIIEVNARLSRSSALASKATGYPLAYIAAKLALLYPLPDLKNKVTNKTTACFEPSLDYCVVKIPRWDLGKFHHVSKKIGSSMKSVGEVMSIGRTFEEALQKALRMVESSTLGFYGDNRVVNEEELRNPSDKRIFMIAQAISNGYNVNELNTLTNIDRWFLMKMQNIIVQQRNLESYRSRLNNLPRSLLLTAKQLGFSDKQIAHFVGSTEIAVRGVRHSFNLQPCVKQIDTVAAEYPAETNYLYLTYNGCEDDVVLHQGGAHMVLGSGVYRIGSSVEFDWCAVGCTQELRKLGYKTIMVNYNPETVSTDYDMCDRLYFEEISFEVVMDVYELENPEGVIVSMGGQLPNNIALLLHRAGANVLGTRPSMIDSAENRFKFSRMLDWMNIAQPKWKELTDLESAVDFATQVGYPVLVRPSYVLSGAAMSICHRDDELKEYLGKAAALSPDHPVVISKFIMQAKEIDVDAVACNGEVLVMAISEHVENAGVHSGDATLICPPQDMNEETLLKIRKVCRAVGHALQVSGPFNLQIIAKENNLKVIECNVRVSRSFPFVSKTLEVDFVALATKVILGLPCEPITPDPMTDSRRIGIKVAQFSFSRLSGADALLGVDMASTGEVAAFGYDLYSAYLKAMVSSGFKLPKKYILLSIGSYKGKQEMLDSVKLLHNMGYTLYGSSGTADYYNEHGITITSISWPFNENGEASSSDTPSIGDYMSSQHFDLVINLPLAHNVYSSYSRQKKSKSYGYLTRRMAIDFAIPLITDIKVAKLFVMAVYKCRGPPPLSLCDILSTRKTITLPGLIDVHVHLRDPGATHKETFTTGTSAALAGGVTMVCAMPNTNPPIVDKESFELASKIATSGAVCDYALFVGASLTNWGEVCELAPQAAALKMYLCDTFTTLRLDDNTVWLRHLQNWPAQYPLCIHAEQAEHTCSLPAILFLVSVARRPVHICHVSKRVELELVITAKQAGLPVTCEVSPHHLFLTNESTVLNSAVRPALGTDEDRQFLWDNLKFIDIFATDHAPHTVEEKTSDKPPAGFPGLETMLPLLLTAVAEGRLTVQDIILRLHTNPIKIFNLPEQPDTFIEVDMEEKWTIPSVMRFSKAGWTPFKGMEVQGSVSKVVLRGNTVFIDGKVLAEPGYGEDVRRKSLSAQVQDTSSSVLVPSSPASPGVDRVKFTSEDSDNEYKAGGMVTASPKSVVFHDPVSKLTAGRQRHYSLTDASGCLRQISMTETLNETDVSRLIPVVRHNLNNKHILTVKQFDRNTLHQIFTVAHQFKRKLQTEIHTLATGCVLGTMFFEPSTRTHLSFTSAMQRLGGTVITLSPSESSLLKGESVEDTVRNIQGYCDIMVMRHPTPGQVTTAARHLHKPLINGGDGVGEHPTQALLDVFTIREEIGTVNGITVTMVGDLKHGRTVHSLARLLTLYNVKLQYVSPSELDMPADVIDYVKNKGIPQTSYRDLLDAMPSTDVLYVTRIQKERFPSPEDYEKVKDSYLITPETLIKAKPGMVVMHPLPRVNEISVEIDADPRAAYFRQAENGVYVRMALLAMLLGKC